MIFDSYRSRKAVRDDLLRRRKNHASQEACTGCGFCFMHNSLEMFLDGVFTEMHSVGDLFVGKTEHEINDDHLLTFGQMIALLDIGIWALEFLLM